MGTCEHSDTFDSWRSMQQSHSGDMDGLVAFQNENYYLFLGERLNAAGKKEIFLEKAASGDENKKPEIINSVSIENSQVLFFKMEGKTRYYDFYYKTAEEDNWKLLALHVDAINLSTQEAKGFVGTMLAMYASKNHFN